MGTRSMVFVIIQFIVFSLNSIYLRDVYLPYDVEVSGRYIYVLMGRNELRMYNGREMKNLSIGYPSTSKRFLFQYKGKLYLVSTSHKYSYLWRIAQDSAILVRDFKYVIQGVFVFNDMLLFAGDSNGYFLHKYNNFKHKSSGVKRRFENKFNVYLLARGDTIFMTSPDELKFFIIKYPEITDSLVITHEGRLDTVKVNHKNIVVRIAGITGIATKDKSISVSFYQYSPEVFRKKAISRSEFKITSESYIFRYPQRTIQRISKGRLGIKNIGKRFVVLGMDKIYSLVKEK